MASPKSSRKKRVTSAAAEAEKRGVVRRGKPAVKKQRKIREPKLKTGAAEDREVEFSLTGLSQYMGNTFGSEHR